MELQKAREEVVTYMAEELILRPPIQPNVVAALATLLGATEPIMPLTGEGKNAPEPAPLPSFSTPEFAPYTTLPMVVRSIAMSVGKTAANMAETRDLLIAAAQLIEHES